ncbi:MAG: hypothetical protein ACW990_16260 [Promethearchaeota archaeon]|jgi:hypothetical protein
MNTILEEFWIFSKDGTPFVKFYKENSGIDQFNFEKINTDLKVFEVANSIVNSNGKKSSKSKCEVLESDDFKLAIAPCLNDSLLLIFKTTLSAKTKKIQNICNVICSMIKSQYVGKDFRTWEGDIKIFSTLKKKIDLYFKMSGL